MVPAPIPAICYSLPAVSGFCRSVALAVAFQQHTRMEWVSHKDSSVLNAMYTVLFWKEPPGVVEVRQSTRQEMEKTADQFHERFLNAWVRKLHEQGPAAANAYISELFNMREYARGTVMEVFREAAQLNLMISGELKDAIVNLARIKLAGSVGVAVLGAAGAIVLAPAGALMCGGVSLGYSTTTSMIKTWEQGETAKAVGVEFGKAGTGEVLGRVAEARQIRALADQSKAQNIIRSCEGQIRKYSQRLGQEGLRKAQIAKSRDIVSRSTAQMARQQQVVAQTGRAAKLAGAAKVGVPLVFAAIDIWGAWSDYDETVASL